MISSLKILKKHLRVDSYADDDEYIVALAETAESYICRVSGRALEEFVAMGDGYGFPPDIDHVVRLLVGHWYEHRSSVETSATSEVPLGVQALLAPYRKLVLE